MALICDNCGRGIMYGHAVSHAKNRIRRVFRPNLQKLKVLRNGIIARVKLCTSCIQRLKKDGRMGALRLVQYAKADKEIKETLASMPKIEIPKAEDKKTKEKKKEESLKIEDIVGKQ